jgi:predicted RNA-binding protein with PIN domain
MWWFCMIIIVDAYNLLRTVPPYKKKITDQERKQFIAYLRRYGRIKGHKMVIVFDGGPYEWPVKEKQLGILVVYSGIHESADDYIREYIEAQRAKEMLLVTSDRELNNYAAHFSVPSIDSFAFYQLLQEAKNHESSKVYTEQVIVKTTESQLTDIDLIMMNASSVVPEKAEDIITNNKSRESKKRQLVKEERLLLKKLRKL